MKVTEHNQTEQPVSKLEAFSNRKFTLELTGFEVLAIHTICGMIGGLGKFRNVFSVGSRNDPTNLSSILGRITGLGEAKKELHRHILFNKENYSIYVDDCLDKN